MKRTREETKRIATAHTTIMRWLDTQRTQFTQEQWWESYRSWARGGDGWNRYSLGGTYIQAALTWYQHVHRPGSREWRPSVIMRAVFEAAQQPKVQP